MNRRRHQSPADQLAKNLRDYAVPIIGLLFFVFIVFNIFSWGESTEEPSNTDVAETSDSSSKMSLSFDTDETEGFVEYSGWNKDSLAEKVDLYPGEKLLVETGNVTLKNDAGLLMKLNKNGELKYDLDGWYLHSSSDLFVKTTEPMSFSMKFLDLVLSAWAVVSLNQNDIASNVNVLSGEVEVSTFAGKKESLSSWKSVSVTSVETTKEDYDLSEGVDEIWNYFFSETWAQENDLMTYLETENTETGTGETDEWATDASSDSLIVIEGITDQQTYGTSEIDVSGSLKDDSITKITFNNQMATINLVWKSFELKWLSIPLRENDVVYKIYDATWNILDKWVYTVYFTAGAEATTTTETEDFPVTDSNPQFSFTSPSPNPYTSNEGFITIRGAATAGAAASVTVNGLKLNSFNGTTWRYHAALEFGTLKNWVNLYKVNYFDASGKVLHTNTFTIIRKVPTTQWNASTTTTPPAATETPDATEVEEDDIRNRIPLD